MAMEEPKTDDVLPPKTDMNKLFRGDTVPVRFTTRTFQGKMPSVTYHIPVRVTMDALSDFVNSILGMDPPVAFNFLCRNEFIVFNVLEKYMKKRNINKETTLDLEYTPAFDIEAGTSMPHDDWVSTICRLPLPEPEAGTSQEDPALTQPYLTGSYDRCVRIWRGKECLYVGGGHTNAVKKAVVLSASEEESELGKRKRDCLTCTFVTASKDGTVRLWKFHGGQMSEIYRFVHNDGLDALAVTPDGTLVASGGFERLLRIWSLDKVLEDKGSGTREYLHCALLGHSRPIMACGFGYHNRAWVFSAGLDGNVRVHDVREQSPVTVYSADCSACYCLAVKPCEQAEYIVTGHTDNKLRLWDTRTKGKAQTFIGHKGWIYDVCWNSLFTESTYGFSSASEDGVISIWDIRGSYPLGQVHHHKDGVLALGWLGRGVLLSGSKDCTVRSCVLNTLTNRWQTASSV